MSEADWERPTALHTSELVGQRLGSYLVRSLVGAGGMGEVYAGEQPEIGKKVAIKVLKAEGAVEREQVERMLAEARAVNAIRHPNIVDVFDFGRLPDGRPYLVMDWLEGEPLDALLRRAGPLPALEAIELLAELCAPLAAAHAKGIIHRDLKPANVFVSEPAPGLGRQVKLLDFGVARSLEPGRERLTRAGLVVGTPDYLSPEQATNQDLGPSTDLYALGVIAFEALTGELPFTGAGAREVMVQKVRQAPPRVSSRGPSVPAELEQLVSELLERAPGDRPRSAEEVRKRLLRLKAQLKPPTALTAAAAPAPAQPGGGRWLVGLVLGGAGAAAIAVGSVFFGGRDGPVVEPPPPTPIVHPVEATPPAQAVEPPPPPARVPRVEPVKRRAPTVSVDKPGVSRIPSLSANPRPSGSEVGRLLGELYGAKQFAKQQHPDAEQEIELDAHRVEVEIEGASSQAQLDSAEQELKAFAERYSR